MLVSEEVSCVCCPRCVRLARRHIAFSLMTQIVIHKLLRVSYLGVDFSDIIFHIRYQPGARRPKPSTSGHPSRTVIVFGLFLMVLFVQMVLFPLIASMVSSNGDSSNNFMLSHNYKIASKQRTIPGRTPDGTFNGGPIYLQSHKPLKDLSSHVHCVGEKYQADSWQERSCHFHLLCYNASAHDYVVFQSEREFELGRHMQQREFMHVSDMMHRLNETNSVAIGGINLKWGHTGIPRMKWFPKIVNVAENSKELISYYELPPATVLAPFHSMNGANPGHHVWDDYLPIYTLLEMFQLDDNHQFDVLPIRYKLQDGERGLWASCDLRLNKTLECNHIMRKFWPLMVGIDSPYKLTTNEDAELIERKPGQSSLVCARNGIAGIGSLTDHGLRKAHGWEESDYKTIHNHGRGGSIYAFRNFMLRNMQMDTRPLHQRPGKPYKIVFSTKSSDIFIRNMDFERQIEIVRNKFPELEVESYTFKEHTLRDQLEVASSAAIYVTTCGGGAVTGMFLPKGGSVFIYYAEDGGLGTNGKMNGKPALLDWDLFNSMSHLRVHWIPRNSRRTPIDENALVMLIRHELELIQKQVFVT